MEIVEEYAYKTNYNPEKEVLIMELLLPTGRDTQLNSSAAVLPAPATCSE